MTPPRRLEHPSSRFTGDTSKTHILAYIQEPSQLMKNTPKVHQKAHPPRIPPGSIPPHPLKPLCGLRAVATTPAKAATNDVYAVIALELNPAPETKEPSNNKQRRDINNIKYIKSIPTTCQNPEPSDRHPKHIPKSSGNHPWSTSKSSKKHPQISPKACQLTPLATNFRVTPSSFLFLLIYVDFMLKVMILGSLWESIWLSKWHKKETVLDQIRALGNQTTPQSITNSLPKRFPENGGQIEQTTQKQLIF